MNKDTHAVDAHNAAAQEHDNTAKSHRAAAEHCSKGSHDACYAHAKTALDNSAKAHDASKAALDKSAQPVPVAAGAHK